VIIFLIENKSLSLPLPLPLRVCVFLRVRISFSPCLVKGPMAIILTPALMLPASRFRRHCLCAHFPTEEERAVFTTVVYGAATGHNMQLGDPERL